MALSFTIGASAQTETILHAFTGGADGGVPIGGPILDSAGNLYGTTIGGGSKGLNCTGCGVAFELIPGANGGWTEKVLYSFDQQIGDPLGPQGPLVFDANGNLYGTSSGGGSYFDGTVFELTPGADGSWTNKVIYSFTSGTGAYYPQGGVAIDNAGNLYGVADGGRYGFGTVYELVAGTNGTWTEKVLYSFTGGNDGAGAYGRLTIDQSGNLYGVTAGGGLHDYGVVFELMPGANGTWTEKVVHALPGGPGGSNPTVGVVMDAAGNLYGAAYYVVFELIPNANGTWTEKVLHDFRGGTDGASAMSGLILDKAGNLYGTTDNGGYHRGTVFVLIPNSGGTWTEKILHRFSPSGGDGVNPMFNTLAMDAAGHVYGITQFGGSYNQGVVFEVAP